MSKTYSFGLDFYESEGRLSPVVNVFIRVYSKWGKFLFITHECRNMKELDFEIDRLREELEGIRKKAEIKFNESKKGKE